MLHNTKKHVDLCGVVDAGILSLANIRLTEGFRLLTIVVFNFLALAKIFIVNKFFCYVNSNYLCRLNPNVGGE